MDKVILIGYFGETVELCEKCGCTIVGVVDSEPKGSYKYLGNDDQFISKHMDYLDASLVITPDNACVRRKIYEKYKMLGFKFKTLIAPEAVISSSARISEGCVVQSLCNISTNVTLGLGVRINTGANIMHDVSIGDFSIVAPGAVLLGGVEVGECTYIGANSTILPHIIIGRDTTIGAGAVVTKDVIEKDVVVGVPARSLVKS